MSPRFAQHVDPIFMHVANLLALLGARQQPSAERERRDLNHLLWQAERELSPTHGRAWELAKYALVAWIDEMLLNESGWSGRDWWLRDSMEWEHFRSSESHEMFFVKFKEATELPGADDALEMYYVCVMLGFRGFYGDGASGGDSERVRLVVDQFQLPPDLNSWSRDAGHMIKQRRARRHARTDAEVPERRIAVARPMWARASILWPWLLAPLLAALVLVLKL